MTSGHKSMLTERQSSITFKAFLLPHRLASNDLKIEEMTTNKGIINTPMTSAAAARRFLTNKAIVVIVLITVLWSSLVQFGCESASTEEIARDGEQNMMRR